MHWQEQLAEAVEDLQKGDAIGAFRKAFGAMETCFRAAALKRGCHLPKDGNLAWKATLEFLRKGKHVSEEQFLMAQHLGQARHVVAHGPGFEPSVKEADRAIQRVRSLCARFGTKVNEVMASPVINAYPNQPLGEIVRLIIDQGISQFPVVDNGRIVGTLREEHVFRKLDAEGGELDPETPVKDLMDDKPLRTVSPSSSLEEARTLLQQSDVPALLVLKGSSVIGIVTKYDLLRRFEM